MRWSLILLAMGCAGGAPVDAEPVDTDGDGLADAMESTVYRTDPNDADTDDDGLTDWEDLRYRCDPLVVDTDGDGYTDRDEVIEGHDPSDPEDRIYTGRWAYNPEKAALVDPGWDSDPAQVATFPRFAWPDQFGEPVDLYDLGGHGKYVVLDVSAMWCHWCHALAFWLDSEPSEDDPFYQDQTVVREAVASGDLLWITALDGNAASGHADETTVALWYEQHPNARVPVVVDAEAQLIPYLFPPGQGYWPALVVLDEDLHPLLLPDLYAYQDPIAFLAERLQ